MNIKKNIISKYNKKIDLINRYNKHYYEDNSPLVDDKTFDNLKKEILELEKNNKYLKNKKSPNIIIGYSPSKNFAKAKHRAHMLSLSNAFDHEDLQNFEKKIVNFLNIKITILLSTVLNQKLMEYLLL